MLSRRRNGYYEQKQDLNAKTSHMNPCIQKILCLQNIIHAQAVKTMHYIGIKTRLKVWWKITSSTVQELFCGV